MANDINIEPITSEALRKYRRAANEAIVIGVREALLKHKRAGNPVAISRNGEVVLLKPDDVDPTLTSLDAIWNNTEDDVYARLLER